MLIPLWTISNMGQLKYLKVSMQGTYARKVISEVYTFFALQCTVFGRKSKHKTDVEAWHGIHFHKNNLWNNYVNFKIIKIKLLSSSDTRRTLMHLFLFTISAQRELVSICTQNIRNCNFLTLHYNLAPCYIRSACFSTAILFHNSSDNF